MNTYLLYRSSHVRLVFSTSLTLHYHSRVGAQTNNRGNKEKPLGASSERNLHMPYYILRFNISFREASSSEKEGVPELERTKVHQTRTIPEIALGTLESPSLQNV